MITTTSLTKQIKLNDPYNKTLNQYRLNTVMHRLLNSRQCQVLIQITLTRQE